MLPFRNTGSGIRRSRQNCAMKCGWPKRCASESEEEMVINEELIAARLLFERREQKSKTYYTH